MPALPDEEEEIYHLSVVPYTLTERERENSPETQMCPDVLTVFVLWQAWRSRLQVLLFGFDEHVLSKDDERQRASSVFK